MVPPARVLAGWAVQVNHPAPTLTLIQGFTAFPSHTALPVQCRWLLLPLLPCPGHLFKTPTELAIPPKLVVFRTRSQGHPYLPPASPPARLHHPTHTFCLPHTHIARQARCAHATHAHTHARTCTTRTHTHVVNSPDTSCGSAHAGYPASPPTAPPHPIRRAHHRSRRSPSSSPLLYHLYRALRLRTRDAAHGLPATANTRRW